MKGIILKVVGGIILVGIVLYIAFLFMSPAKHVKDTIPAKIQNAVLQNDVEEVKKLLSMKSININDENQFIDLPLFIAIDKDYEEMFDFLIHNGANINVQVFKTYSNALELAILKNNLKMVKKIVNSGYDINTKNSRFDNALSFALKFNSKIEIIKLLIELGINKDYTDEYGLNYLHLAAESGSRQVYDYLLDIIPAFEHKKTKDGQTMLHFAAISGNLEFFKYILLDRKFDPKEKDKYGRSILHLSKSKDISSYIINELSFNVNDLDSNGETALIKVFDIDNIEQRRELVKYLIDKGTNVNVQSKIGYTPLHKAAFRGDYYSVKLLIDKGADVNIRDARNITPLHLASETTNIDEYPKVVKLLLESGADKTVKDNNGMIPLELAINMNSKEIVELLK